MRTDDPSYVLKIDATSGETVWREERSTEAQRESPDSYTTPALLQYDGISEVVITGGDAGTGHDPDTGQELWRADGLNPRREGAYRIVASPLTVGDIIIAPTRVRPLLAPGVSVARTKSPQPTSIRAGPCDRTPYAFYARGVLNTGRWRPPHL